MTPLRFVCFWVHGAQHRRAIWSTKPSKPKKRTDIQDIMCTCILRLYLVVSSTEREKLYGDLLSHGHHLPPSNETRWLIKYVMSCAKRDTTARRSGHRLFGSTWPLSGCKCADSLTLPNTQLRVQIYEKPNDAYDEEKQKQCEHARKEKTQILMQDNKSLCEGPSVFIWLTGESECVTGSDEKCIWAGFLLRAGRGR